MIKPGGKSEQSTLSLKLVATVLMPVLIGLVTLVLVVPWNLILVSLWLGWGSWHVLANYGTPRWAAALATSFLQWGLWASIVILGILAPVKTVDQRLRESLTLLVERMTLKELAGDSIQLRRDWCPNWIKLASPSEETDEIVVFPQKKLSVQQFIDAIESQTNYRHRFKHCGSGTTLLWGGDCSFGLELR